MRLVSTIEVIYYLRRLLRDVEALDALIAEVHTVLLLGVNDANEDIKQLKHQGDVP